MSVDPPADTAVDPRVSPSRARGKRPGKGRRDRGQSPEQGSSAQPSLPSKLSAALANRRSSSPATITIVSRFFRRPPSEEPPARTRTRHRTMKPPQSAQPQSPLPEQGRDSVSPEIRSSIRSTRGRRPPRRRILVDLSDTSDVWQRRSVREKMSLSSIRPRTFLHDLEPPRFVRLLFGHHGDKRDKRNRKGKSKSKNKTKKKDVESGSGSGEQSLRGHRQRHRRRRSPQPSGTPKRRTHGGSGRDGKRKRATSTPAISSPMPMPMPMPIPPANLSADDSTVTSATCEPTVQFVHPLDDGRSSSILAAAAASSTKMQMPVPKHMVVEEIARAPTGSILQLGQLQKRIRRNDPSQQKSVRVSAGSTYDNENEEDDSRQQQLRIYRVLGRKSGCRDLGAKVDGDRQLTPVLVTIARDGSIVSDTTSRPSEDLSTSHPDQQTQQQQKYLPRHPSPIRMPVAAPHAPDNIGTMGSPGVSSMTTDGATDSMGGADSFATARLFTGTLSPEPMPGHREEVLEVEHPASGRYSVGAADGDSDEVSDIAMREHLEDVGPVDQDSMGDELDKLDRLDDDRSFAEWLKRQAVVDDRPDCRPVASSIAQAVAQMQFPMPPPRHSNSNSNSHVPAGGLAHSQQRHYSPSMATTAAGGVPPPSFARAVGSDQMGLLEGMLARVADLESRFTCVEALMGCFNDKLDILLSNANPAATAAESPQTMSTGNAQSSTSRSTVADAAATTAEKCPVICNLDHK
ncbi:hypothetical protein LPJ53_000780 [Coemansia erecta]|uniref:Uncharacterized protein n=1 Tax=Coemansia erecta TaxID=147472 RepID=A0A9W8CUS4_9FUNG|nr:hypothetical protein LPJ53_000780 [Coemansia erecta]